MPPFTLYNKKIKKPTKKNYLSERKVREFFGRTVKKIKSKSNSRGLNGLENNIMEKVTKFYEIQNYYLDELEEERPLF